MPDTDQVYTNEGIELVGQTAVISKGDGWSTMHHPVPESVDHEKLDFNRKIETPLKIGE
jgi:hypothetical protein